MPPNSPPAARRLVVATANPGKLAEFRSLLAGLPYALSSMGELGLPSPQETGTSFLENALLKARHAAVLSGFAALADDSGLEVDALHGAPGVYSARFAGPEADDAANNAKLMRELAGVSAARRTARYRCVLAFLRDADDPMPVIAEGVWEGLILDAPSGDGGFGYDPYFYLPGPGVTAAQLPPLEKNRLSHRGKAMRELRQRM